MRELPFAADGRDLGVVGERRFWKAAGFEPGTYSPAKRSYAEAASMAFENTLSGNVFMRRLAETGKPDRTFYFSCYPSKMHSAEIRAMIRYAKLRPSRGDGRGWRTQKGANPHNLQTDYLGWLNCHLAAAQALEMLAETR